MANKRVNEYKKYCLEKGIKINSEESLKKFKINYLKKEKNMSKEEAEKYVSSVKNSIKYASTQKNNGKELTAKTEKDFDKINHNSKATREQYKKNNIRLLKIAAEKGLIENANFNEFTKDKFEIVRDILKKEYEEKGKNEEQVKSLLNNYDMAYNFAVKELGPNKSSKQKQRQRAIDFWMKPHNAQQYLPFPREGLTEKVINRTIKLLKEVDKMYVDTKEPGSKTTFNDYPKHLRNFVRYAVANTELDSLYVTRTKHFQGFITSLAEYGMSSSVQQNGPTAVRFYSKKFDWKYKDTIPATNVGLGADKRIFAKIDNSATKEEVERAKAYYKEKGMLREYFVVTAAAAGSFRIEELTDEITLKKLEKALETRVFHIDDGKNGKPRDVQLFDDRNVEYMKEIYDFMKENNLKNLFKAGGPLNPDGMDQRALIKSIEKSFESSRFEFQDEDRIKRSELYKIYKENEDKTKVIGKCFLSPHSFRAHYAVEAYEHYKQQQLAYLEKHGIEAMKFRMYKYYKDEIETKQKENEKRAKKGERLLKIKGKSFKDLEKDIIRYIEDSAMLYSSRQIGHNRTDVTKIYICKVIGDMRKFVDLESFKEYHEVKVA